MLVLFIGVVSLCAHKNKGQEEKTVSEKVERSIDTEEDVAVKDNNTAKINGLEVPAYDKNDEVIRRTAYTVSYNHETKIPKWVAWHLTADHVDGSLKRKDFDFTDDMSVVDPKGYKSDYWCNRIRSQGNHRKEW